MSKKVVLFFPAPFPYNRPWKGVPLSLLSLSRFLVNQDYEVKIISRFLNENPEKEALDQLKDGLCLGITAMTGFQIYDGLKIAKIIKNKYPQIPIVWGGWHPSLLPQQTLENKYVDIVVKGQGDWTFPEIISCLENKQDLGKIAGIGYKKKSKLIFTQERPQGNINDLPSLPYDLVEIEKCLIETEYGQRTLPYISSYGCPFHCGFCVEQVINKGHWSGLNAQRVVNEWEELKNKYQIDSISIYDSNFFVDKKRVEEICQNIIKKKLNLKWGNANGRIPQLVEYEPKIWQLMQKSGCRMILVGAESGSQKALDLINKQMKVEQTIKLTKLCKKYHIKVLYSFLVGLPWSKNFEENKKMVNEEHQKTLNLIDQLLTISDKNRFTYYLFLPYPGAPLFKRAVDFGLKVPQSLTGWSNYLLSPEDGLNLAIKQKWVSLKQAKQVAMLTQYIFGLLDFSYYSVLFSRVKGKFKKFLFLTTYQIGRKLALFRWKFKFFNLPIDYWVFSLIYKYGGLI